MVIKLIKKEGDFNPKLLRSKRPLIGEILVTISELKSKIKELEKEGKNPFPFEKPEEISWLVRIYNYGCYNDEWRLNFKSDALIKKPRKLNCK